MATVPAPNESHFDALHTAFPQEQIDRLRDLIAGYRVRAALIAAEVFGCFIGTLGVWLAFQ